MAKGKRKTIREGRTGLREDTYRDGKKVSSRMVRKPVDKVVAVGTKKTPAASTKPTAQPTSKPPTSGPSKVSIRITKCERRGGKLTAEAVFSTGGKAGTVTWHLDRMRLVKSITAKAESGTAWTDLSSAGSVVCKVTVKTAAGSASASRTA